MGFVSCTNSIGKRLKLSSAALFGNFAPTNSATVAKTSKRSDLRGRRTRCHFGRPVNDERNPVATFPVVAFHSAPWSRAVVVVIATHVEYRRNLGAIVAGNDNQGVVGDAQPAKCFHQFANDGVKLKNEIAMWSRFCFPSELVAKKRGQMNGLCRMKMKERFAWTLFHMLTKKLLALF